MSNASTISVIIPHNITGNSPSRVRGAIDSVLTQTLAGQIDVLVTCMPSSAESVELQALYGARIKVIISEEMSVEATRNLALRSARGRYSVFLPDDCILADKNSLERILRPLEKDQQLIAYGGGYQLAPPAGVWDQAYLRIQKEWIRRSQLPDKTTENLFDGFLAMRSGELKGIEFEESVSFARKLRDAGKKVRWFEDIKVQQSAKLSFGQFLRKGFAQGLASGRYPKLMESRILYDSETASGPLADRLFHLCFEVGRQRSILPLGLFLSEALGINSLWRKWRELRTLAELYRRGLF